MSKKEATIINNSEIKPSPSSSSKSLKTTTKKVARSSPNLYKKRTQNAADEKFYLHQNRLSNDPVESLQENNNFQSKLTNQGNEEALPNAGNSIYFGRIGLKPTLSYLETEKALFDQVFHPDKNEKQIHFLTLNNQIPSLNEKNSQIDQQNQNITINNEKQETVSNCNFVNIDRPPLSPKSLQQNEFTMPSNLSNENKAFYLKVPTQTYSGGNNSAAQTTLLSPRSYYDNYLATTSNSPLSNKILEESYNKRKTSYSPLHSFTKLNNIRKKSISEISLILEVIRNAAMPVEDNKNNENYYNLRNKRDAASLSPYLAKNAQPNNYLSEKNCLKPNECVSLSTGDLTTASKTSSSNGNVLQYLDKVQRRPSFSSTPTLPGSNSIVKKCSHSVSPPQTLSRISSFIWYKKNNVNKIRWERFSPHYIQKQMLLVQEEKAMQMAPTGPIDATKFVAYVQERRKKKILFKGEYLMAIRSVDPQKCLTTVGVLMSNRNQYVDTLPYNHNRVILHTEKNDLNDESSNYINASYVQSWLREKAYVVTQAVKTKEASNDFWCLVWELRSNCIVMLTKVFDFMRVMCLQYWPMGKFLFGNIEVETLETKSYAHFIIRTFRLRQVGGFSKDCENKDETRIVKHFHFTEWELNSFPYISAFIELRRRVRQWTDQNQVDAPIVVHCSNGGGRSGAFLALDANLDLFCRTGQIDVFHYAKTLVNSRQHLIDSVDQYTFIYDVIYEALLCNIQPIAMYQLKERSTMYKWKKNRELMEVQDNHENKLLLMLTTSLRIGDCAGGHRLENRGKNRDVMVVPPDHARPYLQTLHGESKDYTYINAVEVDGFTRKSEFIVTEWPKQQTLDSFWTLIFDHSVHTVINLTNPQTGHNSKVYPPFIHSKGKKNYGPFMVEILNHQQYSGLVSYMVKITKRMESMQRRKPSAMIFRRKNNKGNLKRRPTLRHFLEECNERRRYSATPFGATLPTENASSISENFCLQQKYWGRVRSNSFQTTDSEDTKNGDIINSDINNSDINIADIDNNSLDDTAILRRLRSRSLKAKFEELKGRDRELALEGEFERARQASVRYACRENLKRRERCLKERRKAVISHVYSSEYIEKNRISSPPVKNKRSGIRLFKSIGIHFTNNKKEHLFQYPESLHNRSSYSHPDLGTLERFEKPTESMPIKQDSEKANKGQVSKLRVDEDIHNLLNVRRTAILKREIEQLKKLENLTFMISEIMASGANQQQIEAEIRICCVIQVKMWPIENKVPLSTSSLIDLIRMSRAWRKRAPDRPETKPTVVMSHNGVSRCGIFIGANVCIDQMDMDHEVDVFHTVKMIRLNRPQLIDMKDEYKYLYDLMLHWYMNNPEYRVYEPPEHEQTPPVDVDNENIYNSIDDNSSTLISTIASNLTRSRSGSRKRTCARSVRSHQQCSSPPTPTSKFLSNNILSNDVSGVENSGDTGSIVTQKKKTIYLN